ncbi:MAG TPA: DUF4974 domain-containing protein [Cyclobacteriaceae bacterium]|nr:DUF4974 domain-containing protein [Cyclobacteriaceae bacterium]HRJ81039.1 DUF4974 domain-containing protein [Cyclobacteriaceae bacterium]
MDRVSLIYKVLSGEANPSEQRELEDWIAKSEANRQEFEDIKLLWENSAMTGDQPQEDDNGFEKIKQRMHNRLKKKRRLQYALYTILLAIVAVLFALLLRQTWLSTTNGARFNNAQMNEVVSFLEKQYHIKIDVDNSKLLHCQLTATFYKVNEQMALKSIEHSLNVEFIARSKSKYSLAGNDCSSL